MNQEEGGSYTTRPPFEKKFRSSVIGPVLQEYLRGKLTGAVYDPERTPSLTKEISDDIKNILKGYPKLERYKYVVQVIIGEQRGEGVKVACRCFWDSDTDAYAKETFINDSIFCVATAYGVYYY